MPLVKYRTNGDRVNEIMVDSSITVSDFINLVNRRSDQRVSTSVFRGKVLNGNDLIRNHITRTDQVLTLLTDSSNTDIVDLDYESDESKKKKEVKNTVSSSILKRDDNTLQRRGFLYTFTVYTTATPNSLLHGHKMDFSLKTKYSTLKSEIKSLISSFPEVNYEFKIHIFLAGGVYFHTDSLLDYYHNPDEISHDNIYVIVEKKCDTSIEMSEDIHEPCNCSNAKYQKLLSPFCESSQAGLSQIAAFLGYAFHGGVKSERILLSLAKITRFAPLVVNLFRLIEKRPLKALNILAITSPLFTLFRSMLPPVIKDTNVFEYTLNFLSLFGLIQDNEYLKFFEIDTERERVNPDMNRFVKYCIDQRLQKDVIVWTADTVNPDFQAAFMNTDFSFIENIFENSSTFKPVAPLSLHYIFYPTFVRGKEENSVMLYIKEVPDKNKVVSIIDPLEGEEKEINIEDLANAINCDTKDDVFSLIDPNQVDELLFICFDESQSMKWKLAGGNPHHNEKKRCEIASEFLESLVKQSYALRVSSFFGLISFSSEIKILQSLTPMSSEFIRSLKKIQPSGKTLLFDAINLAKEQICTFMRDQNGKTRFPNLRLRIIVITDGEDNKSSTLPENLVDDLIRNEITVDTVLVSLMDRSPECCTISKLTGGLCFRPRSLEEGIRIFNQEAFLNLKSRHMNPLPYSAITKEIFDNETQNFVDDYASYAPNQMILNAQSKVSLATPMYMSYVSTKTKIKSYRIMRAFIELNIIARNPNENYVVYSLHSTPEEWRIFIKGPAETPFSGKWLNLYMTLPSKYPYDPPQFRFLTIPFHPNISAEGTVVFDLNNRNYSSSLGIDFIITKIIEMLKNPDPNYAINSEAMQLFTKNREEFNSRQEAENTGLNDYHQYLDGIKIYNEIPVNAVVPEEDRSKSKVVSITMDAIRKAALGGGQVQDACLLDINDYEMIKLLGEGGFGAVYLVADKLMHYEYAAKIPSNSDPFGNPIFDYIKEVNVISKLFNHGAIVKIYGYCLNDFDGNASTVIIMENVPNGDLKKIIDMERNDEEVEGWDDTQKLINLYGIASGMAYSISYGIAHSDLKPANILMTNELYPKISDFDTAKLEEEGFVQSFNMSGNDVSSPLYTAPEIIEAKEGYEQHAEKSDVYSFSIIAYEIITGQVPFPRCGVHKLYMRVVKGERPLIPPSTPERYKSLITDTWNGDPAKRPTFQQVADRLKSDEFVQADGIDRERLSRYFNYIEHYKTTVTESKQMRPKTQADKRKSDPQPEDAISKSGNINIINLKEYDKQKLLGKGRFGQVYLILLKETNQVFAAKISNQRISITVNNDIFKEINIMKSLNHPTILRFVGYSPVDFDGEPKPTIITEYASKGSVYDVIQNKSKHPALDETKMFIIIYGIVAGMAYLHEHSILHNDLKPSNVLLDHNLHPKICDFGLSDVFSDSGDKSVNIKGTPSYIAPEIWDEQGCQPASDVYSFGILLYELVFSQRAFEGMKPVQIGYQVTNNVRPQFPSFFKMKSNQSAFKPLIQRCWDQDPKRRFTFKELLVELRNKKYQKNVDQQKFSDYLTFIGYE